MMKSRFKIALRYMLVTIFLVGQWTPSHAHLNVQHNHDGEIHQHFAKVHAHLPVISHAESSDVDQNQEYVVSAVNLDHDKIPASGNIQDDSKNVLAIVGFTPLIQVSALHLPECNNALPRPPPRHIGEPRAPPQFS